jgi:hypothetical protein
MVWIWSTPPPKKAHVLKAWSQADGAIKRWLDHKGANIINELINWWVHSWVSYQKWGQVRGSRSLGVYIWKVYIIARSFLCFFIDPDHMRWTALLYHNLLLPWCSASPQVHNNGANQQWNGNCFSWVVFTMTKTSD